MNQTANTELQSLCLLSSAALPFLRTLLAKSSQVNILDTLFLNDHARDLHDEASEMMVYKLILIDVNGMIAHSSISPYEHNHDRTF